MEKDSIYAYPDKDASPVDILYSPRSLEYFVNLPYKVVLEVDPNEGGYVVIFPELRGCLSIAETLREAFINAVDAKREWFRAMLEENLDIPAPITYKTEEQLNEFQNRVRMYREGLLEEEE